MHSRRGFLHFEDAAALTTGLAAAAGSGKPTYTLEHPQLGKLNLLLVPDQTAQQGQ